MKLDISGIHYEINSRVDKYVHSKIEPLERFVSRHNRQAVASTVKLSEVKSKDKNEFSCKVAIALPGRTIEAEEHASTMFAAIDLVENKLKAQLRKYKDKRSSPKFYQKLTARLRRQSN